MTNVEKDVNSQVIYPSFFYPSCVISLLYFFKLQNHGCLPANTYDNRGMHEYHSNAGCIDGLVLYLFGCKIGNVPLQNNPKT